MFVRDGMSRSMNKVSEYTHEGNFDMREDMHKFSGVDAHYCIMKAMEYLEMADIYVADLENEVNKLKKEMEDGNDEREA